jgi:hypothetical protein
MKVICIEDEAFYHLLDQLMIRCNKNNKKIDKWISGEEAMKILRISSKTTLQKYRDEGRIRYSQPDKKVILYETDSIYQFLEKSAKNTF